VIKLNKRNLAIYFILLTLLGQMGAINLVKVEIVPVSENEVDNLVNINSNLNPADTEYIIPSVPHHYQDKSYWCGIAALEMVYDFYGPDIDQLEIADVARADPSYGAFTEDLRRSTHFSKLSTSVGYEMVGSITGYTNRSIGYGAFEQGYLSVNSIVNLIADGYPIVVLQWYDTSHNSGHFRVVIGYVKSGGDVTQLIVHDPWYSGIYQGPNLYLNYNTFVNLWAYSSNWALFICPWDVTVKCSSLVRINSTFTVTANVKYVRPTSFNPAYTASLSNATIQLPAGFSLAPGEMYTKDLNPLSLSAGDVGTVSWQVKADVLNSEGFITVNASGLVSGFVSARSGTYTYSSYGYTDLIGGNGSKLVTIVETLPKDENIMPIIIISSAIVGAIIIGIVVLVIIHKARRKVPE
jgi:hypothetical protein